MLQINTLMGATCIASLMSDSKLRLRDKIVLTSEEDTMFFLNIDRAVCDMQMKLFWVFFFLKKCDQKEKVEDFSCLYAILGV